MTFQAAVRSNLEISNCFQSGLRALGNDSRKIVIKNTSLCEGSVDLDTCLSKTYPQQNRWDYCLSYNGEVFFVEVHSAITSEVSTVIKKLDWLKNWLMASATELDKLKAKSRTPYYWVQSSGFSILPQSKQFRAVVQAGIKPIARLEL